MMNYKNRSAKSCVYDAFEQAGLPVNDEMLHGVKAENVISTLRENGYTVFLKGSQVAPPKQGFFVLRSHAHLEYHSTPDGVESYPPKSIAAIAIKEQP